MSQKLVSTGQLSTEHSTAGTHLQTHGCSTLMGISDEHIHTHMHTHAGKHTYTNPHNHTQHAIEMNDSLRSYLDRGHQIKQTQWKNSLKKKHYNKPRVHLLIELCHLIFTCLHLFSVYCRLQSQHCLNRWVCLLIVQSVQYNYFRDESIGCCST